MSNPQMPQNEKQERLNALQAEIEQNAQSIEQDFAQLASKEVDKDPELENLFFEDREEFFKKILSLQNQFLQTQIGDKQAQAQELEGEIAFDTQMQDMQAAQDAFMQKHPEADINELMEFYLQLPKDIQAEMQTLRPDEFFEALLALKQGSQNPKEDKEQPKEDLPQQVSGVGADITDSSEQELPTTRY